LTLVVTIGRSFIIFYDYRTGSEIANNQIGMLRHSLLQLIQTVLSTASFLSNDVKRRRLANSTAANFIDRLAVAIRLIAIGVYAFTNGLDEYNSSIQELYSQLETLRNGTSIKMYLANRLEPELENAFRGLPIITIHDHNNASIEYYISTQFR